MTRLFNVLFAVIVAATFVACGSSDEPASGAVGDDPAIAPKLYVFGDSLSDTGNLGRPLTLGDDLPAPFFNNRITNGPVIVDYVAESLGLTLSASNYLSRSEDGTNYAIAGAQAYAEGIEIDIQAQVISFAAKNGGSADSNDIFLVFIGGNDILDAVGAGDGANANLDRSIGEVADALRDLAFLGARRFFLLTAPDIGRTPKLLQENIDIDPGRSARATLLTDYYNAGIRRVAGEALDLNGAPLDITVIDVYAIVNDLIANASAQGYTNTTEGCYITDEFRFSETCDASQFDSFVFFDQIHPSGKTHRLIGLEVARQINAVLG